MDPRLRTRFEVEAIHSLLQELSHYHLLGLKPECAQDAVDVAFRNESRRLHPDRVAAGATPELKVMVNDVFKAINEAYRVLRDPDLRSLYDQSLNSGIIYYLTVFNYTIMTVRRIGIQCNIRHYNHFRKGVFNDFYAALH